MFLSCSWIIDLPIKKHDCERQAAILAYWLIAILSCPALRIKMYFDKRLSDKSLVVAVFSFLSSFTSVSTGEIHVGILDI